MGLELVAAPRERRRRRMTHERERAVFVYTTYPSLVEAERIGKAVLERRLAACVNILPGMISHYWWQGTIERGEEVVMIIKTRASLAESVRAAVKEMHSYDDARDPGAADRGRGAGVSGLADAGDGAAGHPGARGEAARPESIAASSGMEQPRSFDGYRFRAPR